MLEDEGDPIAKLEYLAIYQRSLIETDRKPRFSDFTKEEFYRLTNGCGAFNFRPWFHWYFEWACRRHDFRYARGYTLLHWLSADFALAYEMLWVLIWTTLKSLGLFCVSAIPRWREHLRPAWINLLSIPGAVLFIPIYLCALLLTGWRTHSRYHIDGTEMGGYASRLLMMTRAEARELELNPRASLAEITAFGKQGV